MNLLDPADHVMNDLEIARSHRDGAHPGIGGIARAHLRIDHRASRLDAQRNTAELLVTLARDQGRLERLGAAIGDRDRELDIAALAHDEAALRRDARAASEAMGATATTLPAHAQGAAPAREASAAALEAATPHGRELEPAIGSPAPAASAALSTLARPDAIVTSAHVAAPIDTPAFAPALATQVRWLAQERVQQAQITLNPAGMGPVAVQIVLDGANARVDFSAEQAATRHAIEASLPVLAAALDESGLKLSGGGVHDSAGRQQPGWNAPAAQHASKLAFESDKGVRDIGAPPRASIGRGLVDLVA